jgi:membrane-bound lytic murein transglycosylase B
VKQEAAGKGISQATTQTALAGVSYDPGIIARDHVQGVFSFDLVMSPTLSSSQKNSRHERCCRGRRNTSGRSSIDQGGGKR